MISNRSAVEAALSAVLLRECPPSDLALDAVVSGVPVEETRPAGLRGVDIWWRTGDLPI